MSATIFKSATAIVSPTGEKLRTDPMDSVQTLLIHDLSKSSTYPSQVNPIAINTMLVNQASDSVLVASGLKVQGATVPFANKSISNVATVGENLLLGATSAPFPQLPFAGQTSDALLIVWLNVTTSGAYRVILTHDSLDTTGANADLQTMFQIATDPTGNNLLLWFSGKQSTIKIPYTPGVWFQAAMYMRCDTLNGKPFLFRLYKNGAIVNDSVGPIKTAFYATDNTKKMSFAPAVNSFIGSLGRIVILSGLDSAGKSPDALVLTDYTAKNGTWV